MCEVTAVLNFDSLLKVCLGDEPLAYELLDIYRGDAPAQWKLLETAIATGSAAEAFQKIHRLKGTLASLCADAAAEACAELEKHAAAGRPLVLEPLRAELKRLDDEIARRFA